MIGIFLKSVGILLLCSGIAQAKELYGPYQADVLRVVDGDTVVVSVHLWPGLKQTIKLRLDGVNTPEKRGRISECEKKAGQEATTFTQRWLKGVTVVTVYDVHLGKWAGRVIGKLKKGDKDLSEVLIKSGQGKPYSGGKRKPWC